MPGAFSLEKPCGCGEFDDYLAEVLDDPGAWLDGPDDVDTLEYHAGSLDASPDYEHFEEARETLAEEPDDVDYDPEPDDYEPDDFSGADFGDSDADIEVMFDRLG